MIMLISKLTSVLVIDSVISLKSIALVNITYLPCMCQFQVFVVILSVTQRQCEAGIVQELLRTVVQGSE